MRSNREPYALFSLWQSVEYSLRCRGVSAISWKVPGPLVSAYERSGIEL